MGRIEALHDGGNLNLFDDGVNCGRVHRPKSLPAYQWTRRQNAFKIPGSGIENRLGELCRRDNVLFLHRTLFFG
jgi:hypothetical protein